MRKAALFVAALVVAFDLATVGALSAARPASATTANATWSQQSPGSSPSARGGASMAYDPGTGQLVLFGGSHFSSWFGDTWVWDGHTWTQLHPATSPSARAGASMAYDPATGQLVLFGGYAANNYLNETWVW